MTIDPITLAVVQNGLMMVASEMDLAQEKMSFSPIISEARDRANGIYHRTNGEMIVQGEQGLPLFIGVMQATTAWIIEHCPNLEPGDVVIVNDPYLGGTHLMDVRLIRPVFHGGRLWCYIGCCAHWADIGGSVAGGFASNTTEIQQEGLRIPPVRLCRGDRLDDEMLQLILANCRVPDERVGDLKAQLGALRVGERRLLALLERYGAETVDNVIAELRVRSEREMRAHIETIPDGTYNSEALIDSDGISDEPLAVRLQATVSGGDIYLNLSQSSPPCQGPLNVPWAATLSAIYIAMRHLFPNVTLSAGCFEPVHVAPAPETFLHARYPLPVAGAAAEGSQRVLEAVLAALGQAMPERAYAGAFGTAGNFSLGGFDPETNRPYVMYYFSGGGYGGSYAGDGHSNACATIAFSATQPFEILEQHYPVLFEFACLRDDSGGAGCHRGGLGIGYRVKLMRGSARASFMMDHGRFAAFSLLGGKQGACTRIFVSQDGKVEQPPHISKGTGYRIDPGDWIEIWTPGGGGYGPPRERATDLIRRDLVDGYVSLARAEVDYGRQSETATPERRAQR
jgi:N-methylhydantoinase B